MASKVKATTAASPPSNGSLPKGWHTVRFDDVVRDVNEAERNPIGAGLERFIGLEHIEPENLHLKQWGNLADGDISFTKPFRKGQVLLGKRRAYQRKVAVAEFDGICSSDILTFEPKGDDLSVPGNLKPVKIDDRVQATIVRKGDLLISRSNTVDLVGLVGVFDADRQDISYPDLVIRVRVDETRINTRFLEVVMLSPQRRRHMQRVAAGTSRSMKKINRVGLGSLQVSLRLLYDQDRFVRQVINFDAVLAAATRKLLAEHELKKSLFIRLLRTAEEQRNVH